MRSASAWCAPSRACRCGGMSSLWSRWFWCSPWSYGCECGPFHATMGAPCSWVARRPISAGEFPKQPPHVSFSLFLFENFPCSSLLFHTRAWPLTQPTSPTRLGTIQVRAQCCPTFKSPQSVSTVSVGAHSPCVFVTLSLFPSLQLQATRSFPVLLKPSLAGEGAVDLVSPKNPMADPAGTRPEAVADLAPVMAPGTLLSGSTLLTVWFFNVLYNFGVQSSYMLGYC